MVRVQTPSAFSLSNASKRIGSSPDKSFAAIPIGKYSPVNGLVPSLIDWFAVFCDKIVFVKSSVSLNGGGVSSPTWSAIITVVPSGEVSVIVKSFVLGWVMLNFKLKNLLAASGLPAANKLPTPVTVTV